MDARAAKRDIAVILFRGLSIYTLVLAVSYISYGFFRLSDEAKLSIHHFLLGSLLPFVLLVICGILIWFISPFLATRLAKDLSGNSNFPFTLSEMQDVVFSTIGVYIIVSAIPDIVSQIAVMNKFSFFESKMVIFYFISMMLKPILGIIIILRSKGLVKLLHAIRQD